MGLLSKKEEPPPPPVTHEKHGLFGRKEHSSITSARQRVMYAPSTFPFSFLSPLLPKTPLNICSHPISSIIPSPSTSTQQDPPPRPPRQPKTPNPMLILLSPSDAETAERNADRALMAARTAVKDAREHVRVLEREAAEEARLARIKQEQAAHISKRAAPLGRHGMFK